MRNAKGILIISVFLSLALGGCSKPEEAKKEEAKAPAQAAGTVQLTREALENLGLKSEVLKAGDLGVKLRIAGSLQLDSSRMARVTCPYEGRLVRLLVAVGDKVSQGAEVAEVESPDFPERILKLKSPMAGTVVARMASAGELATRGKEIMEIADLGRLWLVGEVKEQDAGLVRVGMAGSFEVPAYPQERFQGKVERLGGSLDAGARTLEVRMPVDSRMGRLKAGMFADVALQTRTLPGVLTVPEAALQSEEGGGQFVFVRTASERFEKRLVDVGIAQDGRVQVLKGLRAGEEVVAEGSFGLKSELLKGELGEE